MLYTTICMLYMDLPLTLKRVYFLGRARWATEHGPKVFKVKLWLNRDLKKI